MDASDQVLKVVKGRHVASVGAGVGVGGRPPFFVVANIYFLNLHIKKWIIKQLAPALFWDQVKNWRKIKKMNSEIKVIGVLRYHPPPRGIRIFIIVGSCRPPPPFVLFKIFLWVCPSPFTNIYKNDATCPMGWLYDIYNERNPKSIDM